MSTIDSMLCELSEHAIVQNVCRKHEEARLNYTFCSRQGSTTVRDFAEFTEILGDYVQYVYSRCVIHGGYIAREDAASIGKEILESFGSRRNADVMTCYMDCKEGLNVGVLRCLDTLFEGLKQQAVERYTRDVFDRYIPPDDWDLRERLVVEFILRYDKLLPGIDKTRPARYAHDIETLIRAVLRATKEMASVYRRI